MLSSHVLILNRSFLPIHVTTVRRAFVMLYQGVAHVVDHKYETFDFSSWLKQKVSEHHECIGMIHGAVRVPRVLLLRLYDRIPKKKVRFSRHNIFLRDRQTCQYCGKTPIRQQLNIDHVVPRSRGGKSTWDNVVCCCVLCNRKKGGDLPQEAGMRLIQEPAKPQWFPMMEIANQNIRYDEWKPFLSVMAS